MPLHTRLPGGRNITYEHLRIMGILNVTPDSFHPGSRMRGADVAMTAVENMIIEGADILDVGGESSRPGAVPVSAEEEILRIIPLVAAIKKLFPKTLISVDTYRAATASAAIDCGADLINDISAGTADPEMLPLIARTEVGYILMHMKGAPRTMQDNPEYLDVVSEVRSYLVDRLAACNKAGISTDRMIVDPGIGFGKTPIHNLELLRRLGEFTALGVPLLLGASRKATLGLVTAGWTPSRSSARSSTHSSSIPPVPTDDRLEATLATTSHAVTSGCHLVRVHDVKENLRVARMMEAILRQ